MSIQGASDTQQLSLIFGRVGSPTKENWPGVEMLPDYIPFQHSKPQPWAGHEKLKDLKDEELLQLISVILVLDPNKRIETKEALKLLEKD